MCSYTYSKPSATSGEPVEQMVRSSASRWVSRGDAPPFAQLSRNFAEVPNKLMPSASHRSKRRSRRGWAGEPSYTTIVAPDASADASQFHIIHPAVVK